MNQRIQWVSRLAIVPIPVLVLAMVALWVADVRVAWASPSLIWLVHYGPVALGVTFIVIPAARSFLANGQPSVLMLGCGVLLMDIGAFAMPIGFARSSDTAFAIYNTSALLGALCHFAGVAMTSRRKIRLSRSAVWVTIAYAGGTAVMALVIWCAFAGRMPDFFIDGQGGTLLRSLVVSTAVALFALTAGLLWHTNRRSESPFLYWYALGLVLLAAGLTGSMAIVVKDSPLQWVARLTQVVGMVYMCVAVLAAARKINAKEIPLAAVEEAWRENEFLAGLRQRTTLGWALRYGFAVVAVAAAFGLRLVLTAWAGPELATYITFYPAVITAALLAGFGPGVLATALAGLMVCYWILPPVGQFAIASPVDRLGLAIFTGMGLFISAVAELYWRNQKKAVAYDREAMLRESEQRYRLLFQSLQEGFYLGEAIFDDRGECCDALYLDVNPAFERMMGQPRDQLVGKRVKELLPQIEPEWLEVFGKVTRTGEAVSHQAYSEVLRRHFEAFVFRPLPGRFGVLVTDITDRKRAEGALRERERLLQDVIDGSTSPIFLKDRDGKFITINASLERMLGMSREEVKGKTDYDIAPQGSRRLLADS